MRCLVMRLALLALLVTGAARAVRISDERVVFQTSFGDLEFGVYEDVRGLSHSTGGCRFGLMQHTNCVKSTSTAAQADTPEGMTCSRVQVAPVTAPHILRLAKLGAYNTNHFFRVDKGFVAQAPLSSSCACILLFVR